MTKQKPVRAWHFVGDRLRDGRSVPKDGVILKHDGPLVMCQSGLHASLEPFDALQYAPGNILCFVECGGTILLGENDHKDKLICSERKIIVRMDAEPLLRYFARMQALSVTHLWDTPDVVLEYLMTGRAAIRDAARAAAMAAAMAAAWDAARDAAMAAAMAAARVAAWDAARVAAWDAARDAIRVAARLDLNALVYESFEAWL